MALYDTKIKNKASDEPFTVPPFDPGAVQADKRKPIGVPSDYTATARRDLTGMGVRAAEGWAAQGMAHGSLYEKKPQYFRGDEWKPNALSGPSIGAIQRAMVTAGLLPGSFTQFGLWGPESATAYKNVLTYANSKGVSDQEALSEMYEFGLQGTKPGGGQAGGGAGGQGGGLPAGGSTIIGYDPEGNPIYAPFVAPPLELKTTNKKDLASVFRKAVIEGLGEGWSSTQIAELVDAYNWKEIAIQKEAYDQEVEQAKKEWYGGAPQEGGIKKDLNIESPETFLEEELMKKDKGGVQATQVAENYVPAFLSALGGYV